MSSKDLLPFEKYQAKFRRNSQRQRPGLNEAIWEAEEDPELMLSDARLILQELEKVGKKVYRNILKYAKYQVCLLLRVVKRDHLVIQKLKKVSINELSRNQLQTMR